MGESSGREYRNSIIKGWGKMKLDRNRSFALVGSLTVMSLLAAACGSSSSSSSTTTTAATSGSGATTTAAAKVDVVAQAKAEIAKYTSIPTFTAPGPAVDASKLKGKTILVVQHDTVANALVEITKGIQAAGQLLGVTVDTFNGQSTVSTIEQGIQQGINQKVGAIILVGVATSLVPSSVSAANAAKIPLIGVITGQPDTSAPGQGFGQGLYGASGPSYQELGKLVADNAIVNSNGSAVNAAIITFDNPIGPAVITGIKSVFSSCSNCKIITTQDIEPQYWPTKTAGAVSSLILANPSLNYIFPVADTIGIFATAGVSQAGASGKVFVVSDDGSSAGTLGLVQKGPIFTADPGYSAPWAGWEAMDQALRAMSGMQPGNPVVPIMYLDKSNLTGTNLTDLTNVFGNAYVAGYKQLWGLG